MTNPLSCACFDTPFGRAALAWSERGLYALELPSKDENETLKRLRTNAPGATLATPPPWVHEVMEIVATHLGGAPSDLSRTPVDLERMTPFSRAVYDAARAIPPGQTTTYGALAAHLGRPSAARAVGRALAKNPLLLVVPCHRILGANGSTVGFSAPGGVHTKARLLALEGAMRK